MEIRKPGLNNHAPGKAPLPGKRPAVGRDAAPAGVQAASHLASVANGTAVPPSAASQAKQPTPAADLEAVANAVIRGLYGNGEERKQKLAAAGYDYNAVQAKVNEILKGAGNGAAAGAQALEQVAREVIQGKWGNGQERVNKLAAAGYDAAAVQRKVNELLK